MNNAWKENPQTPIIARSTSESFAWYFSRNFNESWVLVCFYCRFIFFTKTLKKISFFYSILNLKNNTKYLTCVSGNLYRQCTTSFNSGCVIKSMDVLTQQLRWLTITQKIEIDKRVSEEFGYLRNTFLLRVFFFIKQDPCCNRKIDGLLFTSCQLNSNTVPKKK